MSHASKMRVVTVDKNGKELGDAKWVDIPVPDSYATDGFAHIESYVTRLVKSSARFTSLIIAPPDGQIAVSLWQKKSIPEFSLSIDWRLLPGRERALRQFFIVRNLSISHDYLGGNGDVRDAIRCLGYFLPSDAQFIIKLTKDLLREIYHLREQDALDFAYEESM